MSNRHKRQSFLGPDIDRVLDDTEVTIVGLCGGGSHVAQQLAHIGVRRFNLVDHDHAEDHNINRMVGLTAADTLKRELKVDVIACQILAVNPNALIKRYPNRWQEVIAHLKHSRAILGCVDTFRDRDELERFCRRYLIPYIDVGMDVHGSGGRYLISGQAILSLPGEWCLRCYGFITEARLSEEAKKYGKAGGRPQVVWPNGTLASTAVAMFMQLLLPWSDQLTTPPYIEYDGNRLTLTPSNRLAALIGRRCPHFDGANMLGDVDWDAD